MPTGPGASQAASLIAQQSAPSLGGLGLLTLSQTGIGSGGGTGGQESRRGSDGIESIEEDSEGEHGDGMEED